MRIEWPAYLRVLIGVMLLFLSAGVRAQEKSRIIGRVLNGETEMPIPNASVFITNTSKGTITNNAGSFELNSIPAGNYDLVISSVGYATQVFSFSSEKLPLNLKILLAPKAMELDSITVEPYLRDGWEEWGKFFIENFIGTSAAAKQTRIKNYKAIRFRFSKKKNLLTAVADEPLIIENRALGYKIQYQLEDFRFNFTDKTLFYLGYNLFEDMSEDKKRIPKRYLTNRKIAYEGSMMHFMRSLYSNELIANGFEVKRMYRNPNTEKERVRGLIKAHPNLMSRTRPKNLSVTISGASGVVANPETQDADSSSYYERILRQPDFIETYGADILTADSLVSMSADSSKYLFFQNYLYVKFLKSKEPREFLVWAMQSRQSYYPISQVFLVENTAVEIAKNGSYFPPQNIFSLGFWAWSEKIAHTLPLDYRE